MTGFYLASEDQLCEVLGERLLSHFHPTLQIIRIPPAGGNQKLKQKLSSLIKVSSKIPVLVLTDLDQVQCAPLLVRDWIGDGLLPPQFFFRIAVREAESWLLADREGFAKFIGAPQNMIPINIEALTNPKQTLLQLVKRYADRSLKEDLLPAKGSQSKVGIGYNQRLVGFVRDEWNLDRARIDSDSLERACKRLNELVI